MSQGAICPIENLSFIIYNNPMSTKRTYQPSKVKRARTYGFRARNKTQKGRLVLKRRALKGRRKLIP